MITPVRPTALDEEETRFRVVGIAHDGWSAAALMIDRAGDRRVALYLSHAEDGEADRSCPVGKRDLDTIGRLGGPHTVLQMQIYLRNHGFPDLALDGKRSDPFDNAMTACFINDACGRGIAIAG